MMRPAGLGPWFVVGPLALCALAACHDRGSNGMHADAGGAGKGDAGAAGRPPMSVEQARDPKACMKCHPNHYNEWQASMHAYAARDPVFLAMNARGQRETNGQLGDFCVKCHAPMAVMEGMTKDGLNLPDLPDEVKGVTCYFCHNATSVDGAHNATVKLSNDVTMRGPIEHPKQPGVHKAEYSAMFNGDKLESSSFCGGCHDIVTPNGVHLERTFEEYGMSVFANPKAPTGITTCSGCHMPGRNALAADDPPSGVVIRRVHEHLWPGVDVHLDDSPGRDVLTAAVADCELSTSISLFTLDVDMFGKFTFTMETQAGHAEPSGAAQDRRLWLEVVAFDDDGKVSFSSGQIADDEIEERPETDPKFDKNLFMMRDRLFDADGMPTHMFWKAAPSDMHLKGFEANTLPVPNSVAVGTHTKTKIYPNLLIVSPNGAPKLPARVTARLRMRPMGLDVLQDLVDSGDLDASVLSQMQTFTLADATLEWKRSSGSMQAMMAPTSHAPCKQYQCLLYPDSDACKQ
jgi:hypothetical protein